MPLPLPSTASGLKTSVLPTGFGSIKSPVLMLPSSNVKPRSMLELHGLFSSPKSAVMLILPENAPIGALTVPGKNSTGVKLISVSKLESFTLGIFGAWSQSGPQPTQSFVRRSGLAPGDVLPSQFAGVSKFSMQVVFPGSNGGGAPSIGVGPGVRLMGETVG